MNLKLSVGNIIIDTNLNKKYRVIAIVDKEITLCEMNTSKFNLLLMEFEVLFSLINDKDFQVQIEEAFIVNKNDLPDNVKEKLAQRKAMMFEIEESYGPSFMGLVATKKKPKVEAIMKKYNCSRSTFWRICCSYFQSGMTEYSLVDARFLTHSNEKEYNYKNKTGRATKSEDQFGIVINDEVRKIFNEAIGWYKSGKYNTMQSIFDKMNLEYFSTTTIKDGVISKDLLAKTQRPTFKQFAHYVRTHITTEEKDIMKMSVLEYKNNKRLLPSDSMNGVKGPCDMVEIDACEADISLVSAIDPTQTVGRPIVYFMIDVYSRVILAMSVAFDNNSILGLTSLFLNLADDKQKYCEKYGISYDNPDIWPSNVLPNAVRVDKGAEFRGKEFERICDELGIKRNIVAPGCGSLKGVVEQSFRQLHLKQNMHLENCGMIEKRHDSKHHQTAMLNIEEYTKMVIGFVLTHNQQCILDYPLTKDMIKERVKSVPALLWKYGIKNCCVPRELPPLEQYLFNLMTPIKAKVGRKGIIYKNLYYINMHDKKLKREMINAGNKQQPFEARMDMRDVGAIYYLRDNKLVCASLNHMINGNAGYDGLTMKQYEEYLRVKRMLVKEGKIKNEELSAFNYALNESIVKDANKLTLPDHKNIRSIREIEKQLKSKSNNMKQRLDERRLLVAKSEETIVDEFLEEYEEAQPVLPQPKEEKSSALDTYDSWAEALEDW